MKYLVGVVLMLAVVAGAYFLEWKWPAFPAIGAAAGLSFVIGTNVRTRER